ncbi:MAG: hypothetical protein GY805_36565 [Chloroflexi bacterium]|nr:hypothetical protein [Chloroflexota bacterium]
MTTTDKMWWQQHASPTKLHYLQKYAVGKTALDLGTGAGHYAKALVAQNFNVIGLDLEHHTHLIHSQPFKEGSMRSH